MTRPNQRPLLSLRGIGRRYGHVLANDDIDLDIGEREIHAIVGENGAGKSTLMRIVFGVEQPDEGRIFWQGRQIRPSSPAEARALGIGMVFQHFSVFETLTVAENIALVVPGPRRAMAARLRAIAAETGLTVDPDASVAALSVGERQRIEILRCLMLSPRLLILDEPTSVLAPQAVEKLFQTLRGLRDGGMSILLISHKLEEIRGICDRATILRGGRVTGLVDPRAHSARELAGMMTGGVAPAPAIRGSRSPGGAALELRGLDRPSSDPMIHGLHGIDMVVRSGEIVGIAGVSGNGQTALTALITGERRLPRADAGMIRMSGRDVGAASVTARRRLGLAYVPEERLGHGAVPPMTLTDNMALTRHRGAVRYGRLDRRCLAARAAGVIARLDVRNASPLARADALSGGTLQKFIIGRELSAAPRLLVAAQPTWGIDIHAATSIRSTLLDLRKAGTAILVISEQLDELFELCDRLHVMRRGRLSPSMDAAGTDPQEIGLYMMDAEAASDA